jgi:hypothetical protein
MFKVLEKIIPVELYPELRALVPEELLKARRAERSLARSQTHNTGKGVRQENVENFERVQKLRRDGLTVREIGLALGVSRATVGKWLKLDAIDVPHESHQEPRAVSTFCAFNTRGPAPFEAQPHTPQDESVTEGRIEKVLTGSIEEILIEEIFQKNTREKIFDLVAEIRQSAQTRVKQEENARAKGVVELEAYIAAVRSKTAKTPARTKFG